ncbi:MAG: glycosyltransferase [Phycisphaerae bacterium]|nr:glycosyltransferase [Phycisphaerae bacterium]
MPRLLVEGWRFSLTSYAVVNQYQLLQMLDRPGLEVFHRDIPFFTSWRHIPGLLPPDDEGRLRAIPEPPPGLPIDASLRIAHPTLVATTEARDAWCWVVTEFGILEQSRIADGRPARDALNTPGVRFITISNWSLQGLIRSGVDPARVVIVPCGFDPSLLHPLDPAQRDALRASLGWKDKFVFLNVSTLVWNKGIAALLGAFAQIAQKHPNAVLVIKGSTELLQSDRRLREALAAMPAPMASLLSSRIQYLGQNATHADLARYFQAADAYVSPYHAEGFNLPVLEAGACGLPVIVTKGGSTDDFTHPDFALHINAKVISHPELDKNHGKGACALVVDGEHLVHLMNQAITDPAVSQRARDLGPPWLRERFTWAKVTDRLLDALFPGFASPGAATTGVGR